MEIKQVAINEINPAVYNPRIITDKELSGLKESIKAFGFVEPLVVNSVSGTLISGHQRFKAAKELGHETVPVVYVELNESGEKALNIAMNNHAIQGKFDTEILSTLLEDLKVEMPDLSSELNFDILSKDLKIDFDPVAPDVPKDSETSYAMVKLKVQKEDKPELVDKCREFVQGLDMEVIID